MASFLAEVKSFSFWPKTMDYNYIVTCFLSVPVILHWKVLYMELNLC